MNSEADVASTSILSTANNLDVAPPMVVSPLDDFVKSNASQARFQLGQLYVKTVGIGRQSKFFLYVPDFKSLVSDKIVHLIEHFTIDFPSLGNIHFVRIENASGLLVVYKQFSQAKKHGYWLQIPDHPTLELYVLTRALEDRCHNLVKKAISDRLRDLMTKHP